MDFLALFLTAKILHLKFKTARVLFAAALGGVYATLSLLITNSKAELVTSLLLPPVFCLVAFGGRKLSSLVKSTFLFFSVSFLMGGGMTAVYYLVNKLAENRNIYINGTVDTLYSELPLPVFIIVALLAAVISYLHEKLTRREGKKRAVEIKVSENESITVIQALCDSGNLLEEPLSSLPVIIVGSRTMKKIVPEKIYKSYFEKDKKALSSEGKKRGSNLDGISSKEISKLRFIPISAVGKEDLLVGYIPDAVIVEGVLKKACIALDFENEDFGGFEAVAPLSIL